MATHDNASLIREEMEAFNAHDVDRALRQVTREARVTQVAFGTTRPYADDFKGWLTAFPDAKLELSRLVAQGDTVVAEFIGRGTQTGPLEGPGGRIPPTGRRAEVRCVNIYECRDGKIASVSMYFDSLSMLTQLGLAPQPVIPVTAPEARPQVRG